MSNSHPISVFWFRRDLRLEDNAGLYHALQSGNEVLPLFIYDTDILDKLEDKNDRRLVFIKYHIDRIRQNLETKGSSLLLKHGNPRDVFLSLLKEYNISAVYANHDYEPYSKQRDHAIETILNQHNIKFNTFKDQVIFEKTEVVKPDGKPYTVFTPYMKKWKEKFQESSFQSYDTQSLFNRFLKTKTSDNLDLRDIGFKFFRVDFPGQEIQTKKIQDYQKTRDIPSLDGTSRLSPHLRFGTISIRKLIKTAIENNETYLNELIWREFYMMILWNFPHVVNSSFKKQYDRIEWLNNEREFEAWKNGLTGYPIVDAGMRQLNETGYMHNRLRMITASFLVKHLLIDWRWGEHYFADKLLDFELSSNNGGWQWAAGSGCDAAPYFRIFSPDAQTKKFDPEHKYIKTWLPEYDSADYPNPLIDHKFARERALKHYKKYLDA